MINVEIDRLKAELGPVVRAEGCELVEVETAGKVLRLFIDREGGVTVEDCARVSRQVELALEVEEAMQGPYTLEVSSPGLTRPLKKPEDYERAVGKLAVITFKRPQEGMKRIKELVTIESAGGESVKLSLKDTGQIFDVSYSEIAKARLEIEF